MPAPHPAIPAPAALLQPALPDDARPLLERLRAIAMRGRSQPRLDTRRACEMLRDEPEIAAPVFADALLRTLRTHLGSRPRFFAPGSAEVSFDERWLLALLLARRRGDAASARFLVRSRVAPPARAALDFLSGGLAARLGSL
jgi:hypothetical protein